MLGELPCCSHVLQSVVLPRCRGTAEALQITVGHVLGDAGSPYVTGLVRAAPRWGGAGGTARAKACRLAGGPGRRSLSLQISGILRAGRPDSYLQSFLSLQQSFLCCTFVIALGGGCFLLTALRLEGDQALARQPGTGTPPSHPCRARGGAPQEQGAQAAPEPAGLLAHLEVVLTSPLRAPRRGVNTQTL